MNKAAFGPSKETFGFNSFRSFIDHVDYFQHVKKLQHGTDTVIFDFETPGIPIYDIFEFAKTSSLSFKNLNIIVVETLNQFLSIVSRLDKSKKYIIFSESFWDTSKYPVDLDYDLIYMPWDLIDYQTHLSNRSTLYFYLIDLDFFSRYQPKYDFLCLIGRYKPWRSVFVQKLQANVKLDNTLTSYYGHCLGSKDLLSLDFEYTRNRSKVEFENKFYSPITVEGTEFQYNLSYFTKSELLYKTKFNLVVETEAELQEYHVTEKVLKSLISGHPFIIMGTPYYLRFLHDIGFTTYNTLFDESYDSIVDLNERMDAVLELTKKLKDVNFKASDLKSIQEKNLIALIKLRNHATYEKFLRLINDNIHTVETHDRLDT